MKAKSASSFLDAREKKLSKKRGGNNTNGLKRKVVRTSGTSIGHFLLSRGTNIGDLLTSSSLDEQSHRFSKEARPKATATQHEETAGRRRVVISRSVGSDKELETTYTWLIVF